MGAVVAAGVIGLMGFYGFATAVQKSAVAREVNQVAMHRFADARMATPTAPTPSMLYALSDAAPAIAKPTVAAKARLPEPAIDLEPAVLQLVATTPSPAPPAAITAEATASPSPPVAASGEAVNTSAVEPTAPAEPQAGPIEP